MLTKKHAYTDLPPSKNHASQGKNVHTKTRNSAFPRALPVDTLGVRDRWQLCLARVNLLQTGYLQVKRGSGR